MANSKKEATAEILKLHEEIKRAVRESLHQNKKFEKEMNRFAFIGMIHETIMCSFNLSKEYSQFVKGLVVEEHFSPSRENLN